MIAVMMNQHIVGHKHIPEMLLIKSRIKNLSKQQQKEFMDEYSRLVNMDYFWRLKKRTGKGTECHNLIGATAENGQFTYFTYLRKKQ